MADCLAIPVDVGRSKALLIDTPGFDDSSRTDSEILTQISRFLAAQYEAGMTRKGVIYLHRITDTRYQGASIKTLNIFKKICCQMALKNVVFVTTRKFWACMLSNGPIMSRFYGDKDSTTAIASQLISKRGIHLEIQRELVDKQKRLQHTVAGSFVSEDISDLKKDLQKQLNDLDVERQNMRQSDRAAKQQIQKDTDRKELRLAKAQEEEIRLRRDIAAEVRQEIEMKTKEKKRNGVWK